MVWNVPFQKIIVFCLCLEYFKAKMDFETKFSVCVFLAMTIYLKTSVYNTKYHLIPNFCWIEAWKWNFNTMWFFFGAYKTSIVWTHKVHSQALKLVSS